MKIHFHEHARSPYISQDTASQKYGIMYYKNGNMIGVRRKFGDGKQCFSFGGSRCSLSEATLRGFGDDCLKKLNDGESEEVVRAWVRDATKP